MADTNTATPTSNKQKKKDPVLAAADKVAADLAKKNDKYLKKLGKQVYGFILAGAAAGIATTYNICPSKPDANDCDFVSGWNDLTPTRKSVVAAILITLGILAFLSILRRQQGGIRTLLIGKDGRFSTSATQVAMWTMVIAFSLIVLILRSHLGGSGSFANTFDQLDASYLLLLGGPFAAAAISRSSTSGKVESGELQKTPAAQAKVSDVISNDNGYPDLVDTQFFVFNIVVLVYFIAAFTKHPTLLPNLPLGLVGLSSGSALVYTGDKIAQRNAPLITSVTKEDGTGGIRPGDEVIILGANFVPPGGNRPDLLARVKVKFGAVEQLVIPDDLKNPTTLRPDRIVMQVPQTLSSGNIEVTVVTAANVESSPYSLQIMQDVPVVTGAAPLPVRGGSDLLLTGRFFQRPLVLDGEAAVFLGSVPVETSQTTEKSVVVHVPDIELGETVAVKVFAFGGSEGSQPITLPVKPDN